MSLSDKQEKLKQALIDSGEEWNSTFENILKIDSHYFEAYVNLRRVPRDKRLLSVKVQELLLLAMDAACTHLYEPGIRLHTAAALKAGATQAEIMETLECSSVLGVHAVVMGLPKLLEVMEENGKTLNQDLDSHQQHLKEEFTKNRGYWGSDWDPVLRLSPKFFEGYLNFSSVPFREGHNALDAKTKELVYCAIDCSTTHLCLQGLKVHIRNAMKYGATEHEIFEVFELAALMGVQTTMRGSDILVEEMSREESKGNY